MLALLAGGEVSAPNKAPFNDVALDDGWWAARTEFGPKGTMGAIQRLD